MLVKIRLRPCPLLRLRLAIDFAKQQAGTKQQHAMQMQIRTEMAIITPATIQNTFSPLEQTGK